MKTGHQQIMEELISRHEIIAQLIGNQTVHYVDIPVYENIGDLLIMQGTLKFLNKNQIRVAQICSYFNFHTRGINKHDVVLFQGGGNLGDLYRYPQQTRAHAITLLPNNKIIILPQTIYFHSSQAYEVCCHLFSRHPDLHIFVRDNRSYELAQPMSRHVYLMPDMAHQLWPIQYNSESRKTGHLGIIRTDGETAGSSDKHSFDLVTDWPELVGRRVIVARAAHLFLRTLYLAGMNSNKMTTFLSRQWINWANVLVHDAIALCSKFDYISTDRLHGHILACLMDIPHTLIDNSYGKNSTYAGQWTEKSDIVHITNKAATGTDL